MYDLNTTVVVSDPNESFYRESLRAIVQSHLDNNPQNQFENGVLFADQFVTNLREKLRENRELTESDFISAHTGTFFKEPVIAANGFVYEKEELDKELLQTGYDTLPDGTRLEAVTWDKKGEEIYYLPYPLVLSIIFNINTQAFYNQQLQFNFQSFVGHILKSQQQKPEFLEAVREKNWEKLQSRYFLNDTIMANRNAPDALALHQDSPLHQAVRTLDLNLLNVLLADQDNLIDFNQKNAQNETAFELLNRLYVKYTKQTAFPHSFPQPLTKYHVAQALSEIKQSIDSIDSVGNTAVHRQVNEILGNKQNGLHQNPQMYQNDLNNLKDVLIMSNKASINQSNGLQTPLGLAVAYLAELPEVVDILLQNGAGNGQCDGGQPEIDVYLNSLRVNENIKQQFTMMRKAHEKVDTQFKPFSFHVPPQTEDFGKLFRDVLNQYAHPPLFTLCYRHHQTEISNLVKYFDARMKRGDSLSYDTCMAVVKGEFDNIDAKSKVNRAGTLYGVYLKLAQINPTLQPQEQQQAQQNAYSQQSIASVPVYMAMTNS